MERSGFSEPRGDFREDEIQRMDVHMACLGKPWLVMPHGELDCRLKETPLCELEPQERQGIPLCSYRGRVDITQISERLEDAGELIWTPEGQKSNVEMIRPGHDRWGIQKVVLIMCDDFCTQLFHFPWWQQWRPTLSPLFEALGINPARVIRCLLARMSPGAHIPTHHDSGDWVPLGHRLHIPISGEWERVLFSVGYTEDTMSPVQLQPGHVFELNNSAKHAVWNGSEHDTRTHLIFDYVDHDNIPPPRTLQTGQVLSQTRRSIDVCGDPLRHPIPAFLILGAQKAGTTSLYAHICEHPLVLSAFRKEPHFLDWRWNTAGAAEGGLSAAAITASIRDGVVWDGGPPDLDRLREEWCSYMPAERLRAHPSLMCGEATPSYLLHSDICAPRLLVTAIRSLQGDC